jgi:hypothetical protein
MEVTTLDSNNMSRLAVLSSLIQFDAPLADLRSAPAALDWDSDPVAVLTRRNIVSVLQRFATGEIDADAVEAWANLVECREDIQFEPQHERAVADAIHDLANPILQGRLQAIAADVLARLQR